MASGFFALLDDIAVLMDDVATMSKVTAKKTAGILGDDLAVNAEKASGFLASREIPVLWAITKGSFLNKIIILPIAFLLSAFWPYGVYLILILGGIYLAYEGAEKVVEFFFPHHHKKSEVTVAAQLDEKDLSKEKDKIRSAVVTDFILSVEIVIIALGTVVDAPLSRQIMVVSFIALIATIGVYGIVALIVRMDDLGFRLIRASKSNLNFRARLGRFLVSALPWVIKGLAVVGTLALLLVAGGIFNHQIEFFHHLVPSWPVMLKEFLLGLAIGSITVLILMPIKKIISALKK